jgi:hypothetical protein
MTKPKAKFIDVGPPTTVNKPAAQPAKIETSSGAELPYTPPDPQPPEKSAGVWQMITTESDNSTKDAGLVLVAWLGVVVLGAIPCLIIGSYAAMYFDILHKFDGQGLGVAIGSVCAGFGAALGALGAYRNLQAKATP